MFVAMKYFKFPRTYHLPWSPGSSSDDKMLSSVDQFVGKEVIASEKSDGECTTLYRDHCHARSINSGPHPSRTWIKQMHASICGEIPEGLRICGENMYAKHSIQYFNLPSYFLVFSIFEGDKCLSWDETEEWCKLLNLHPVPLLYRGIWDEEKIKACMTGISAFKDSEQEGYVVRVVDSFPYKEYHKNTGKYVRKGHVQTSEHWMQEKVIPNKLIE